MARAVRWDLIADPRRFNRGFRDAERTAEHAGRNIGRTVGRVSSALGVGLGASALGAFATSSVKTAATFDKQMRQVATVAKLPSSAIADLRDQALDMGAKTSFSASQAGDAMLELAKGGMTAAQIKGGALASTLTLAAAGGIDLGDSAGYVVKSLNTFDLGVSKSADVAAALAGGANASTASVEDLGMALSQVGPGAKTAGLDIQETVGVLAAFADAGITSTDAGTSLKTMLTRLVPSTKEARTEMRRLGLDFVDSKGNILDIEDVAQQLQDRLGGLTQAQKISALQTIFGSDATRAATVLLNQGSKGLAKYIRATHDRAAAEKLARSNTEGAAGSLERLQGAIETTQIKLGTVLLPAVADGAELIAEKAIPAVERWGERFRTDLTPELGRVQQAWDDNKGSLANLITTMNSGQVEAGETADAAKSLADALVALADGAGKAARGGGDLADWLNKLADQATDSDKFAAKIHDNVVRPIYDLGDQILFMLGVTSKVEPAFQQVTSATAAAGVAADEHASALAREKGALESLAAALTDEHNAELDLRQAKLNVQTAQKRLNDLKREGRSGSLLYKQAQIDLERAQAAVKDQTTKYKDAQLKANSATRGAMSAAQAAQKPLVDYGKNAEAAGKKVVAMALSSRDAIKKIPSRSINVTANYDTTAPKGIELLIEKGLIRKAGGGGVRGRGTTTSDSIPALLSDQEHVWDAAAVKGIGHGSYAEGHAILDAMRRDARGYKAGGPVLNFHQSGTGAFLARPPRFDANIVRSLDAAARGFGQLVRLNKDKIFGVGKAEVAAFIRSTDALPYRYGAAGPGAYDCSGVVGAAHLAHLGRPYGHGQRIYTTDSIHAGILGLKSGLGGTLQIGVTPGKGHMAGKYGDLKFEARSSRTGIFVGSAARDPASFARHFHLAGGGRATLEDLARSGRLDIGGDAGMLRVAAGRTLRANEYDRGGLLPPGMSLAINRTGRPERIPDPRGGGIDYRRLADAIVTSIGGRMVVPVDDVHAGLKGKRQRLRLPLGLD